MEKPPRPLVEETTATEPIPAWRVRQEGTRWAKVSMGEWEELQAKRRRAVAKGASLVSLQFLADQVITTSNSLASFACLATRVIWLRKARRRQGEEGTVSMGAEDEDDRERPFIYIEQDPLARTKQTKNIPKIQKLSRSHLPAGAHHHRLSLEVYPSERPRQPPIRYCTVRRVIDVKLSSSLAYHVQMSSRSRGFQLIGLTRQKNKKKTDPDHGADGCGVCRVGVNSGGVA